MWWTVIDLEANADVVSIHKTARAAIKAATELNSKNKSKKKWKIVSRYVVGTLPFVSELKCEGCGSLVVGFRRKGMLAFDWECEKHPYHGGEHTDIRANI